VNFKGSAEEIERKKLRKKDGAWRSGAGRVGVTGGRAYRVATISRLLKIIGLFCRI